MGAEYSQGFNLSALLTLEDLDLEGFAAGNPALPVGEYFALLYKLTYVAPRASAALAKIMANNRDVNDVQSIVDTKTLLKSLGCSKFFSVFDEIVNSIQRNKLGLASIGAEKILDDFNGFYTQIMAAKKEERMEILTNAAGEKSGTDPGHAAPYAARPLKQVLEELDQEEAARKLRILAVDDSPVMLKTISSVLESDYKVFGLTDPLMVDKFLKQITPELFLLDYKMPKLSGFDLVPIIRNFNDHKKTPIIFLTSLGTVDNISTAMALGACDFIVKPFQPDILREKVAKHIVRKKTY